MIYGNRLNTTYIVRARSWHNWNDPPNQRKRVTKFLMELVSNINYEINALLRHAATGRNRDFQTTLSLDYAPRANVLLFAGKSRRMNVYKRKAASTRFTSGRSTEIVESGRSTANDERSRASFGFGSLSVESSKVNGVNARFRLRRRRHSKHAIFYEHGERSSSQNALVDWTAIDKPSGISSENNVTENESDHFTDILAARLKKYARWPCADMPRKIIHKMSWPKNRTFQ